MGTKPRIPVPDLPASLFRSARVQAVLPPPGSMSPCPFVMGRRPQACGQGSGQSLQGVSWHNAGAPCKKQDAPVVTLVGGARLPCPGWGCPDCTPTPTPCGALRPADCPAPPLGWHPAGEARLAQGAPLPSPPQGAPAHRPREVAVVEVQGWLLQMRKPFRGVAGCACGPAQAWPSRPH